MGAPSAAVRWAIRGFLAVFLVCGLVGVEAWPLTGWRLFSTLRQPVERRWEAASVHPDGTVRPIDFASLPRGDRGSVAVLRQLAVASQSTRDDVCRAWADEVQKVAGEVVAEVEVWLVVLDLRDGRLERTPAYRCGRRP